MKATYTLLAALAAIAMVVLVTGDRGAREPTTVEPGTPAEGAILPSVCLAAARGPGARQKRGPGASGAGRPEKNDRTPGDACGMYRAAGGDTGRTGQASGSCCGSPATEAASQTEPGGMIPEHSK
ncbi:MAG: hypothetical protein ACYSX0_08930 [Planctomycetota bacterium]|jgi:hypothetical protein